MKKSLRLFGTLLALVSLTACQDLGSEITETEAAKRQAEIENVSEDKMLRAYTLTMSETVNMNLGKGASGKVKASVKAAYDLDKLYLYAEESTTSTSEGKTEKESGVGWMYYKDGALHSVRRQDGKNIGNKQAMTEAEAKAQLLGELDDSGYLTADINDIVAGLSQMSGGTSSMTAGMKVEESEKFYSKGEGNLSFVAKQNGSVKTSEYTAKYSFDLTLTINNYLLSSCSFKLNYSASGGGEKASLSATASMKGSKGCSISYPTYTEVK